MNKKTQFVLAVCLVGAGIWLGNLVTSVSADATSTPGSIDDPVVTKSYVDNMLGGGADEAKKELRAMIEGFKAEVNKAAAGIPSEVVVVKPGQTLMAHAGAQFVLRAGRGVAYSSDANGISDVTDGVDIKSGMTVPNNHLILFPREGRGVMPNPEHAGDLTVLVLGSYEIKS